MIYSLAKKALFQMSPEDAHAFVMGNMKKIAKISAGRALLKGLYGVKKKSTLERNVFGLSFKNPVGMAAGFDKNAQYLDVLQLLGFGFVEIGTVTPKGQPGNDKPRLFRIAQDNALVNRMGFNNDGAEIVRVRLELFHKQKKNSDLIIGGNIGKNKITENEEAWKDYLICFNHLHDVVDYFVVNVSSPNTPGLRALQEKDSLLKIFSELKNSNEAQKEKKPILLKIAPDLSLEQLDDIVSLAQEVHLDGLVATNTTIAREKLTISQSAIEAIGAGGLSGKPVQEQATKVLEYLHKALNGAIPIIASGGIFTPDDAKEKLDKGAALLQVYTGFIYEGPTIAKRICNALV